MDEKIPPRVPEWRDIDCRGGTETQRKLLSVQVTLVKGQVGRTIVDTPRRLTSEINRLDLFVREVGVGYKGEGLLL